MHELKLEFILSWFFGLLNHMEKTISPITSRVHKRMKLIDPFRTVEPSYTNPEESAA
jgi:hypothetical protein